MTRNKILLISLVTLAVLYTGGAWFFSNIIIHFTQRTLEEDRTNLKFESVADAGLPEPEKIQIGEEFLNAVSESGTATEPVTIGAWYFANPRAARCAVIVHHGHTGTRWGAIKYAPLFWKRGCSILSVDARYHGESGGDCGSYGYHERYDLQRVIGWLQMKTGLKKNQIGLMGESMGASIVMMTAALEPELAFVAGDSPYRALTPVMVERGERQYGPVLIGAMLPGALWLANMRCDMNVGEVAPDQAAKEIKSPVFLSHSASDAGTLPYHSQAIYDNVPHESKVIYINEWDAPHARDINLRPEEYDQHMQSFLREFVPGFGG
ncbi:MAG: alpha/beta fold hydrolase [bacterium]|nr:alpha/beta fold hydrolase [bacterium]